MRLLHIVEATGAGVRRYVTYLASHPPAGWEVAVACPRRREPHFGDVAFVDDMRRLGVEVFILPLRRSIGPRDVAVAWRLSRFLGRGRFDLIHTHSSKAGFIGRMVARSAGIPVVHTPNGLYFLEQKGLRRGFFVLLEALAGRFTDRMIAVSEGERDLVMAHGLMCPSRITVVENGVDWTLVRQRANTSEEPSQESPEAPGEGPLIGSVGRMVPQKDPVTFLLAARQVRERIPDARFLWCGDGELRARVEQSARAMHLPLVVTGHLEDVWPMMSRLDVFVLTSLYEGLPFALLEAMALEVPVVATDVVGTRDVLKDSRAGLLAPPGDPDGLAEAICRTLESPEETRGRVRVAADLVRTRFSLDRMLAAHAEVYAQALTERG
jgi:glycosyltransferase involved in cell wall biosynthesis